MNIVKEKRRIKYREGKIKNKLAIEKKGNIVEKKEKG